MAVLIFVTPANLFYKFAENSAYSQGLLIDYLIPKIYLSDVLILALILLIGTKQLSNLQINKILPKWRWSLILFALLFLRQLFTPHPITAILLVVRSIVFFILVIQLKKKLGKISRSTRRILILAIIGTMVFQALLGAYQFYYQKPLTKYQFLGESNLVQPTGIAYFITSSGAHRILAYGTTSHPNILAGVMVIYLWLVLELLSTKNCLNNKAQSLIKITAVLTTLAILIMTRSWTGWLTLLLIGLTKFIKLFKIKSFPVLKFPILRSGLLTLFFAIIPITIWILNIIIANNFSLSRRNWLNQEAVRMFLSRPIFGVGIGQFVTKLPATGQSLIGPAFNQPVHHTGFLIIAETGLLGIAFFTSIWQTLDQNQQIKLTNVSLLLIFIASLDHYLLTSQTGWLLLGWLYIFYSNKLITNY